MSWLASFFLSALLIISFHSLLACIISAEKSADNLMNTDALMNSIVYNKLIFVLLLSRLFPSLTFDSLIVILVWHFLGSF